MGDSFDFCFAEDLIDFNDIHYVVTFPSSIEYLPSGVQRLRGSARVARSSVGLSRVRSREHAEGSVKRNPSRNPGCAA